MTSIYLISLRVLPNSSHSLGTRNSPNNSFVRSASPAAAISVTCPAIPSDRDIFQITCECIWASETVRYTCHMLRLLRVCIWGLKGYVRSTDGRTGGPYTNAPQMDDFSRNGSSYLMDWWAVERSASFVVVQIKIPKFTRSAIMDGGIRSVGSMCFPVCSNSAHRWWAAL